jgi:hypothetical protein
MEFILVNFVVSYQFFSHDATVEDFVVANTSYTRPVISVTGEGWRRFITVKNEEKKINGNTIKMFMYCMNHIVILILILLPVAYTYDPSEVDDVSNSRTYLLSDAAIIIVFIILSEVGKALVVKTNKAKVAGSVMPIKDEKESTASFLGSSKVSVQIPASYIEDARKTIQNAGVVSLKISPNVPLKADHPYTAVLLAAEKIANNADVQEQFPGITGSSYRVIQLGDFDNQWHVFSPHTAFAMHAKYNVANAKLSNPHTEMITAPEMSVVVNENDKLETSKLLGEASTWPENKAWIDDSDYGFRRVPLISRLSGLHEEFVGWDFFTHNVVGFGVGYGVAFNLSHWIAACITLYYLPLYIFQLHNLSSAFMAWVITTATPFVIAMAGREVQFAQLWRYFLLYGWVIILSGNFILDNNQRYILNHQSWNNSVVIQENVTLTSMDQSPTAIGLTLFSMSFSCLMLFVQIISMALLGCEKRGFEIEKQTITPPSKPAASLRPITRRARVQ